MIAKLANMTGARKKILLKGLLVAGFLSNRIWVRAQRKPEKKAAKMTRMKPRILKAVSPATIMMTPIVIVVMITTSFTEGSSRRKRKAKARTKAREEDLHIAKRRFVSVKLSVACDKRTVESQCNEFQAHVAQPNIETSSSSARTYTGEVEHPGHKGFLRL